jgi:predicted house-cleaning noncanonical NTP pyrophosphatase (MazG superfamily)
MPKLIRDEIPADMESHGYTPRIRVVKGEERLFWLLEKLVEEAIEVRDSGGDLSELGDVYELLDEIATAKGTVLHSAICTAADKRKRRGGFREGYLWIDSDSKEGLNRRHAEDEYRKAEEARLRELSDAGR